MTYARRKSSRRNEPEYRAAIKELDALRRAVGLPPHGGKHMGRYCKLYGVKQNERVNYVRAWAACYMQLPPVLAKLKVSAAEFDARYQGLSVPHRPETYLAFMQECLRQARWYRRAWRWIAGGTIRNANRLGRGVRWLALRARFWAWRRGRR